MLLRPGIQRIVVKFWVIEEVRCATTGEFWQEAGDLSQLHAGSYDPGFFCTFERTIRRAQKYPGLKFNLLILKSPTSQEVLIYS